VEPLSSITQLSDDFLNETNDALGEEILASLSAEQFRHLALELMKRKISLHQLVSFWVERDLEGLFSFMEEHPDWNEYWSVAGTCFSKAPERLLAIIDAWKAAGLPEEKADSLLDKAFENIGDPVAAMAAAKQHGYLSEEAHIYRLTHLVSALAQHDPAAAVAFGERHPSVLDTALSVWSVREPAAVLNWLRERLGKQVDSNTADSVLAYMAQCHPQSAKQYLEMAADKEGIYRGLAAAFKGKPLEDLTAWLDSLPEDGRSTAYQKLCEEFNYNSPEKAAALCMTFPELATTKDSGNTGDLIVNWAKQNPVGAIRDYQAGKIPPAVADKILPQLVESWFLVDRNAAMAFVHAQPDTEQKGRLLLQTSRILEEGDREAALEYALHLAEPASRLGACRNVLERANDSVADRQAWIATIPDEAIRQSLLKPAEPEQKPAVPHPTPAPAPGQGVDPFSDPFSPAKP
jgi:hypothetical protein